MESVEKQKGQRAGDRGIPWRRGRRRKKDGGRRVGGKAALQKKPGGAGASVTPSKLNHTSFWCGRTSENRNGARNKGNAQSPTSNRRVTVCGAVGWVDGACGGWVRG